jgi:hypothetical protein
MAHDPAEWILVIATNPTPGEEEFVYSLGEDRPGLKVKIMPRHQLDSRLALYPDLVDYFTRNALLHQAQVYQQEKALLVGGLGDLTERARGLARVADTLDPDWSVDTELRGDLVLHSFRPKHAEAMQVSPIGFSFQGAFGAEHADLRHVLKRIVEFGSNESVVLPAEVARRVTFNGPGLLAPPAGDYELVVGPPVSAGEVGGEALLHVLDDEGFRRSSYQAEVLHAAAGSSGYALDLRFQKGNTLRLLVGDQRTDFQGNFSFYQSTPSAAMQMITLYRNLVEFADCEVEFAGQTLALRRAEKPIPDREKLEALEDLELLVEDLDIVQRYCRSYFPVPESLTAGDRIDIRLARLLIEGHCVVYRGARTFTATLNGKYDASLKEMLAKDEVTVRNEATIGMTLAQNRIVLGTVAFFHTRVQIEDAAAVLAALEAGRGDGRKLKLVPADGEYFRAYMPSKRVGRDEEPLVATPWGLPGLDGPLTR